MAHESYPISIDDIYKAYEDCRKKKKSKRGTVSFESYALFNCVKLVEEINGRTYKLRRSECFIIDYPTPREVFCSSFRDRVVQHFVYNEINPVIERMLVEDTCSCRLNKGTDYAIKREIRKLRQISDNYKKEVWIHKIDLSGFFMSIDRNWLCDKILDVVRTRYRGRYTSTLEYLIPIIILSDVTKDTVRLCSASKWSRLPQRKTLFGNTKGLAIGNITSQLFANFALNDIDHFIKSRHKGYVRYVDDMVIIDTDRAKLKETKGIVEKMLDAQGMRINKKKSILQKGKFGVPFLGVIVKPYYAVLGRQRISRIYKAKREFKDPYNAYQSIATRKGMFVRYHGIRVAHRWFNSIPLSVRKDIRMNMDTSTVWLGHSQDVKLNKGGLLCID